MAHPSSTAADPFSLEIRLLGELCVVRGGEVCSLPSSKKARALLGFLAATGKPHTRRRLCDLLWEGPDDPRGGLRWALSKLRPLVDDADARRLTADRDHVEFEPCGAAIDWFMVRAWTARGLEGVATGDLERALASFRGPFLEGLDLPDCVGFHTWCVGERELARSSHLALLQELIGRLSARPEQALPFCRSLVALDPLSESSHVRLIELLAKAGRTRDALDEYRRCRELLATHLGCRPSTELEQLRMSLTASNSSAVQLGSTPPSQTPSAAAQASPIDAAARQADPRRSPPGEAEHRAGMTAPATPGGSGFPPLVGRSHELLRLEQALEAVQQPLQAARVALVLGEAGAGKSRLLSEFGRSVEHRGGQLLSGRAFEAEVVRPYGPWLDALRSAGVDDAAAQLPGATLEPAADRSLFFESIAERFRKLAAGQPPLVVVVDDIQWLDEGSAALLHYLARSSRGAMLLACAARSDELADNRAAQRAVRALAKEGLLKRLDIGPLGEPEARELASLVSAAVDAERVSNEAGGNPLFVIELARALERGEGAAPDSLSELIAARLERLAGEGDNLLAWAACLGRTFDVAVLAQVTDLDASSLSTALEHLERRAVVRASGHASYDFVHDLVRRAAYARISPPRRSIIHAQIARRLEARSHDPTRAGEILHHAALGGDHELAARSCIRAGRHCIRVFAYADAGDLARRGLEHAARLGDATRLSLEVELLGLRAQKPLGRDASDVDRALARVALEAEQQGLGAVHARAYDLLAWIRYGAHDHRGALQSSLLRSAAGRASGDVLHVLGAARCLAHLERDLDQVAAAVEQATQAGGSVLEALDFVWARALLRRHQGRNEEAFPDFQRALVILRQEGRNWELCLCLRDLALCELERGSPEHALALSEELGDIAGKVGDGAAGPTAIAFQALARVELGRDDASAIDAALPDLRLADSKFQLAVVLNFAAEHALATKDCDRAARYAAEALSAARAVSNPSQAALARAALARATPDQPAPSSDASTSAGPPLEQAALSARAVRALEQAGLFGGSTRTASR